MAKNRHWNGQGFYRPDSYFGPWSIIPDSLNHYLAIVGTLDLAVLATSAAKSDSPSTPLPTEKPDIAEKKKAKQGELADKQKRHDEMAKDIEDHSKNLQERKDKKSETDQAEIEKSEAELEEKKKNHKALGDEIDGCKKDLEDMDDTETGEEEAAALRTSATAQQQAAPVGVDDAEPQAYELHGDTAIITMSGPITKYPTSFQAVIGGASTVMAQHAIREANADGAVTRIALKIDSPGGTCSGIYELMQEVANSKKPLWAYGEDAMASAAYFAATNASYIACTPTAMIGSVGTLVMLKDTSGKYALDGIKVMAIGTGVHKGAGMDGTEITDEQKAYFQGIVDETNTHFVQAIKTSRELTDEQFADVTKAGVYIGAKAVAAGLVDSVMSFEQFLAKFEADTDKSVMEAAAQNANRIRIEMKSRALLAEMIGAGIPPALAIAEYTAGHTLEQAKAANAEAITNADKIRQKFGVSAIDGQTAPVELKEKTVDQVQATFMQTVEEHMKKNPNMAKREAISQMVSAHPELYETWKKSFPVAKGING